jgi:pyruvate carboxylase subunit A
VWACDQIETFGHSSTWSSRLWAAPAQGKFQVIKKILIANRGEIAVRIVRACAEMGIRSVAIYSDADRHALHVKRADEAHSIGAEPLAGYLNARKLVNLAVETGCDALHPGYGFLSENAELADICAERGIKFIGPSAEVIRRMGDKTEARRSMIKAGVPVTPGTEGNVADIAEALIEGSRPLPVAVVVVSVAATAGKNLNKHSRESFPRRPRPLVRQKCSWKNASSIPNTLKRRSSATALAM